MLLNLFKRSLRGILTLTTQHSKSTIYCMFINQSLNIFSSAAGQGSNIVFFAAVVPKNDYFDQYKIQRSIIIQ